jgi:cholesterol 7alpha-monooxygenase
MPERSIPNMLLAVLWASQANTVPATFWALAFLLLPAHAKHLSEAMHWLRSSPPSSKATLSNKTPRLSNADEHALIEAACDPESPLRKCCLEAVRLRSPSIDVRVAAADVAVPCGDAQYMQIPKGSVVAISPWMTHLDPRAFEGPRDYDPNRNGITIPVARDRALEGRGHVSSSSTAMHAGGAGVGGVGGVAFGGGRYRCPGRGFAEMELALVVGAVLACWRLELCRLEKNLPGFEAWPGDSDGLLPPPNVRKMVGIKVPTRPCWVHV